MDINDVLIGKINSENISIDEQEDVLNQMKKNKIFDLDETQKKNLIDFICDTSDKELAIDYMFHVLDEEISETTEDETLKTLFSDGRMIKLKNEMFDRLQNIE